MNASAVLGSVAVTISSDGTRSAVEFSVSDPAAVNATNDTAAPFLGSEAARAEGAVLLALLPGILCCGAAALLVAFARWVSWRRAACSELEDVAVQHQQLARDSVTAETSDSAPRPEHAGYGGSGTPYEIAGLSTGVPAGLNISSDRTVTNVGTDDRYRTLVLPDPPMVVGVHECTYTLRNSQRGLILLGVVRPEFDPCSDYETNAYDTPDAWLYDVKDGVKCHGGRSESWGGARGAETADRVRMRLDLTAGELEVFLNGDSLGVMVENISGPLCWMVQLATEGDSVHLDTRREAVARVNISSEE